MNKFEIFLEKLPCVKSAEELTELICNIGLFYDDRKLYGVYEEYMIQNRSGTWQNPSELATFLWEMYPIFKKNNISSYLDIGTFNGYTFFIISNFLKVFVNDKIKICSIDPFDHIKNNEIRPYIEKYIKTCTSFDIKNEIYDLVFIDGCHEGNWPMDDFNNALKLNCKFIFFHDIVDKYCPDVKNTWEIISNKYKTKEFCKSTNHFGIGLVFVCNHLED